MLQVLSTHRIYQLSVMYLNFLFVDKSLCLEAGQFFLALHVVLLAYFISEAHHFELLWPSPSVSRQMPSRYLQFFSAQSNSFFHPSIKHDEGDNRPIMHG